MKLLTLIAALALCACGPDDHPPQAGGNPVANSLPADWGGLVNRDNGEGGSESVASAEQELTGCNPPLQELRKLSTIAMTSPATPTCPRAWYSSHDPMQWRAGQPFAVDLGTMVVPAGACQRVSQQYPLVVGNGGSITDKCAQGEQWVCPNGVWYAVTMRAVTSSWSKTKVTVLAKDLDGSCDRSMAANFNVQ